MPDLLTPPPITPDAYNRTRADLLREGWSPYTLSARIVLYTARQRAIIRAMSAASDYTANGDDVWHGGIVEGDDDVTYTLHTDWDDWGRDDDIPDWTAEDARVYYRNIGASRAVADSEARRVAKDASDDAEHVGTIIVTVTAERDGVDFSDCLGGVYIRTDSRGGFGCGGGDDAEEQAYAAAIENGMFTNVADELARDRAEAMAYEPTY